MTSPRPRIGYLVPEFPAQTHVFFWRELGELERLGVDVDLVSTRRPPRQLVSHVWAESAAQRTRYLVPPDGPVAAVVGAAATLAKAGRGRWRRCLDILAAAEAGRRPRLGALLAAGAHLGQLARERGWVHLHVHSCGDSANLALFANLLTDLPYSLTLHGPLEDYGPGQEQKWRHARFAFVITRKLLGEVRGALDGALPADLDIAPMGVDLGRARRRAPYAPYEGAGRMRVFSCGRLNPCKGHDDLIRAIGHARDRGVDIELQIAGEDDTGGGYRRSLEALVAELRLDGRVELLGAVSEPAVFEGLESAHCFALASLHEPLGVAIMEAMAMWLPVVVTGAGGVKELVDDGVDGLLVEPRAPEQMAAGIERVARDPALARRLSQAGRQKIERSFSSAVSGRALARRVGISVDPDVDQAGGAAGRTSSRATR
jgi:glycosyltransferase involved in cell wall biosynthesis